MGARLVAGNYAWHCAVIIALFPATVRVSNLSGLYRPILISSESMAPTLWGPSTRVRCDGCGILLRLVASPSDIVSPICFNCGDRCSNTKLTIEAGDRVLIDTAAYCLRSPKRFDLVALRTKKGPLTVKRLLAGPGERVVLADGDLLVDGVNKRRSIGAVLETAIDVYDDRFRNANRSRFIVNRASGWQQEKSGFRLMGTKGLRSDPLRYEHRLVYRSNQIHRVMDDYPQNQHVARQLNATDDLILSFRCRATQGTRIHVAIRSEVNILECSFERKIDNWSVESKTPATLQQNLSRSSVEGEAIVVGYIDGQLWAGVGGRFHQVDSGPSVSSERGLTPTHSIAIACTPADDQQVNLVNLRVQRDLHWFDLRTVPHESQISLGSSRYFVIGDNVPASLDSRHVRDGIHRSEIIGRVYPIR